MEILLVPDSASGGFAIRDTIMISLGRFVEMMEKIMDLAKTGLEKLCEIPVSTPVGRLDDVKAARGMRLSYA